MKLIPQNIWTTFEIPDSLIPKLSRRAHLKLLPARQGSTADAKVNAILCLLTDKIDEHFITRFPNLKVIATVSVGYDHIDLNVCRKKRIRVVHTPGVLTQATAEFTLALLLACSRRIVEADQFCRQKKFKGWALDLMLGTELNGKAAVLVGAGQIGKKTATLFRALGMTTHFIRRNAKETQIHSLLRKADVLSFHVPLSTSTKYWLNNQRLKALKMGAIVINTARGPIIDEALLAKAIESGRIGSAGLDVFEHEPNIHPSLMRLKKVVLAPHLGSATLETRRKMVEIATLGALKILDGKRPLNELRL